MTQTMAKSSSPHNKINLPNTETSFKLIILTGVGLFLNKNNWIGIQRIKLCLVSHFGDFALFAVYTNKGHPIPDV